MPRKLTIGSCFSGIGGLELGLEWTGGFKTQWQIELDPYASKVLAKHWPDVQRFSDITTVAYPPPVDVICGGFPCQDVSLAGARAGLEGKRSTLWGEMFRLVCEVRPRWVVAENVPGLLSSDAGRFFGNILRDLASAGYDAEWGMLSAAGVGAPHLRRRIFILAHTRREHGTGAAIQREPGKPYPQGDAPEPQRPASCASEGVVANAKGIGTQGRLRKSIGKAVAGGNGNPQPLADTTRQQDGREEQRRIQPHIGASGSMADPQVNTGRICNRDGEDDVPHTKGKAKRRLPIGTSKEITKPGIGGEVCGPGELKFR